MAGCTLTNGVCVGRLDSDWSAAAYLYRWLSVQVPVLVGLAAIFGVVLAIRRRSTALLLIASSVVVPLMLIALANSTIYDGLRHVSYVFPLLFILAFWFLDQIAQGKLATRAVYFLYLLIPSLFVADDYAMFPLNYVYFNGIARHYVDSGRYETDYWGFSLKEAAAQASLSDPSHVIVGGPKHLVAPFLPPERPIIDLARLETLPPGTAYEQIGVNRQIHRALDDCSDISWLTRRLPFGRDFVGCLLCRLQAPQLSIALSPRRPGRFHQPRILR